MIFVSLIKWLLVLKTSCNPPADPTRVNTLLSHIHFPPPAKKWAFLHSALLLPTILGQLSNWHCWFKYEKLSGTLVSSTSASSFISAMSFWKGFGFPYLSWKITWSGMIRNHHWFTDKPSRYQSFVGRRYKSHLRRNPKQSSWRVGELLYPSFVSFSKSSSSKHILMISIWDIPWKTWDWLRSCSPTRTPLQRIIACCAGA